MGDIDSTGTIKKITSPPQEITDLINKKIIDFIIESPLNVDFIPDDIEREMYNRILTVIEENMGTIEKETTTCCSNILSAIYVKLYELYKKCCLKNKPDNKLD